MQGSNAKFFIIAFRFKEMIIIHHRAAFTPKSDDGSVPPARSSFITVGGGLILMTINDLIPRTH